MSRNIADTDTINTNTADTDTIDTDTGKDCADMGWECGTGTNDKGTAIDCTNPGCAAV